MGSKKIRICSLFLLCIVIISLSLPSSKLNKESSDVKQEKEEELDITDVRAIDFGEALTQNNNNIPTDNKESEDNKTLSETYSITENNIKTANNNKTEDNSLPALREKEVMKIYVIGDLVRVRKEPSTRSEILDILAYGTEVQYLFEEEGWTKLQYQEVQGYIRNDLLSTEIPSPQAGMEPANSNLPDGDRLNNPSIIVKKSERILELWEGDYLYDSYPIGLGWEPEGHKKKEGDGRTPEGSYYVCLRNSNSRFYLSLGVSYPNKEEAKEALKEERIDQSTYNQIVEAIDNNSQPPWYTPLGGEIMIHGMGSASDWTAGCIAVDNEVMDILWKYCPKETPILIKP